jgi:membrane-associated phospholipid phosphatase
VIRSKFHPPRDLAIGLAAVLLFAWFAWLASQGAPPDFDMAGRDAIHAYARPWLTLVMEAASLAGGGWGLWPVGVLIAGLLARAGRGREAAVFAIAVLGANFVNEAMKLFFHRPRPEPWFGYPLPPTYSFPSGHSFVSFCFCLCLAEILMRHGWPLVGKVAIWSAALGCTLTIGLSRVYLGVHYPTDVLGGYAAGIVWTMMIRLARHVWQARTAGAEKVPSTPG